MSIIPDTLEVEVQGLPYMVGPEQKLKTLSENKLKQKGLGLWLKWQQAQGPEFKL
jgi:hypothetical protein